ncbi:MAG: ECF transporter S component [Firmicutes bacterium HGW-Firmicutes-16]|nr:MAG: ECF transporter S component [Firmicutes bacterium HGW-Firmicutes-16]
MEKKYSIKKDFSMIAILIIPIAVAVNFVGGQLASLLKLPMYLDTIGTIFAAMLCGPWVGATAGVLTNVVTGIANPVNFAFIPVNLLVGLVTGYLARGNMFSVWWKWILSMFIMAIVSIASAAPIVVLVYGGVTGGGTSLITATAMAAGVNIWAAVIGTEGIFTVLDRIISFVISWLVIRVIPDRTLVKFGCGNLYIKKKKQEAPAEVK